MTISKMRVNFNSLKKHTRPSISAPESSVIFSSLMFQCCLKIKIKLSQRSKKRPHLFQQGRSGFPKRNVDARCNQLTQTSNEMSPNADRCRSSRGGH